MLEKTKIDTVSNGRRRVSIDFYGGERELKQMLVRKEAFQKRLLEFSHVGSALVQVPGSPLA